MAKIISQNPGSSEVQSPLIAGMSEGLSKVSSILNVKTVKFKDLKLTAVPISEEDKNRIYESLDNRLWLNSPPIEVKKNGQVITPETEGYVIDYVGGSVAFNKNLIDEDVITVSGERIGTESITITDINNNINSLKEEVGQYKGIYDSVSDLQSAHPTSNSGDFAIVITPEISFYAWNKKTGAWQNTQQKQSLDNFYTIEAVDNLLNKKEGVITPKGELVTDDDFYYGGRKTWVNIFTKVKSMLLTGIKFNSSEEITERDTILSALGKLQAQVKGSKMESYITGNGEPTTLTVGKKGQRYVNSSNGDSYRCTSVSGGTYTWVKEMDVKTYDTNNNGIVDNAEKLDGHSSSYFAQSSQLDIVSGVANTAKQTAEQAKTNAKKAQSTADSVKGVADSAKEIAQSAQTAVTEVQSTADNAQTTAQSAQSASTQAKNLADSANLKATQASATAESANTTASEASTTASEAKRIAEEAKNSVVDNNSSFFSLKDGVQDPYGTDLNTLRQVGNHYSTSTGNYANSPYGNYSAGNYKPPMVKIISINGQVTQFFYDGSVFTWRTYDSYSRFWSDWQSILTEAEYTELTNDISEIRTTANNAVPKTTSVNNHQLTGNITLTADDVGALSTTGTAYDSNRFGNQLPSHYAKQTDMNNINSKVTNLEKRQNIKMNVTSDGTLAIDW